MAASLGGSLAFHLCVIVGISLLGPSLISPGDGAQRPRLTVDLPHAPPVPLRIRGEPTVPPLAAKSASDAGPIGLSLPEARFFLLAELDTPPVVIQDIDTDPPELRHYLQGGKLVVQLWIDEMGKVVKTEVPSSDLPEPFAASARENFMRAAFSPAKKNGAAVRARISVMLVYRPRL